MKVFSFVLIVLTLAWLPNYSAHASGFAPVFVGSNSNKNVSMKIRSSQQAAQLVKNRYGGKVLKVVRQNVNGNTGYRVKLLKGNGQVISVLVDAYSGQILGR